MFNQSQLLFTERQMVQMEDSPPSSAMINSQWAQKFHEFCLFFDKIVFLVTLHDLAPLYQLNSNLLKKKADTVDHIMYVA